MNTISISEIPLLIAIVLSFISSYVLIFKYYQYRRKANFLLATFLLSNALGCFAYLSISEGWISFFPRFYKIPAITTMLIAPSAYLHTKTIIEKNQEFKKSDLVHLIPSFLIFINYIPLFFLNTNDLELLVNNVVKSLEVNYTHQDGFVPESLTILFRSIIAIVYLIFQLILIYKYKQSNNSEKNTNKENLNWKWAKKFTFTLTAYTLSILLIYIIVFNGWLNGVSKFKNLSSLSMHLIYYVFSLTFIFFSLYIIINPRQIFGLPPIIDKKSKIIDHLDNINKDTIPYQKIKHHLNKLETFFHTQKPYLNQNINLSDIASEIDIPAKEISYILNNHLGVRLSEYINTYRLKEFEEKYNKSKEKYTIEGLSQKVGFKSKSAFYKAFKDYYNQTPKKYFDS